MVLIAVLLACSVHAYAQEKRPLDHSVYDSWNRIQGQTLSNDGAWVLYTVSPQEGDGQLHVKALRSETAYLVPRGESAEFTDDNRFVVFLIKPELALVRESQKEGARQDAQPKDSLGILNLVSGEIAKVGRVKSFDLPEDAGGWLAYHLEAVVEERDTTERETEEPAARQGRRPAGAQGRTARGGGDSERQDGTALVLRNLSTGVEQRYETVQAYVFSKNGQHLAYTASSKDSTADGAFVVATQDGSVTTMMAGPGDYKSATFDEAGEQIAFLSNRDDYTSEQPSFSAYYWRRGSETAEAILTEGAVGIPVGWWVSEHGDLSFSDNGGRLFLGTAPRPEPEPEEEKPEWERVEVDVWNWQDPLLQPMQLVQRNQELRRSYRAVVHLSERRTVQLADVDVPEVTVGMDGDADIAVAATEMPYRQEMSWDSPGYNDVYLIDVNTGERRMVLERLQSRGPELSPDANYITWWDGQELAWFAMDVNGGDPINLTDRVPHPVFDESDDHPMIPGSYGSAGWIEGDRLFLVYDKHDIWATDPTGRQAPRNVTEGIGRRDNLRFRYMSYDPDEEAIPENEPIYLGAFDMETKDAGFYRDRVRGERQPERLLMMAKSFGGGGFGRFGRGLTKAEDADVFLLTRQSFEEFPDLWVSDLSFSNMEKVSDANPQKDQYLWGKAELTHWMSTDGEPLTGILIKPEGFDPSRKYPMMVYFYETMSDGLHSFDAPFGGGSSVSLSFYASRGYVVFVPDIHYRDGYPGESAFDCVVPGVLSVIAQGFVDPERVGVQGHSWGGYQIAYLVTKTNIFAAAEAGAPVANMTSAYGGIRWGTGMSRMFQYERTQSRIGGSLWEAQPRYIENSPLFWADKVETPVLMLHNDEDTAVPWYQGIEYFVALRRLNKPVWMLNYNGEEHGLRKYQNQKDWQVRMQQFFDHYLVDAPPPVWLAEGVPAVMKGKTLGLDLVGEETKTTGSGNTP